MVTQQIGCKEGNADTRSRKARRENPRFLGLGEGWGKAAPTGPRSARAKDEFPF
jgi:hypothetical protein